MYYSQQNNSLLEVYFTPEDQAEITNKLYSLLDNAKKQVLIAIYWITDKNLMEKIIATKNRNVDVQIIIDESSLQYLDITPQLLENGIMPTIWPSKYSEAGLMHNKFVVVDTTTVFAGSANFTQTALNPDAKKFNFENVIIINSPNIAKKYIDTFFTTKEDTFQLYVYLVANNQTADWMHRIVPDLYKNDYSMQQLVTQLMKEYDFKKQKIINNFFGIQIQPIQQNEPLTNKQLALLRNKKLPNKEILNLSKQEATSLISKILSARNWEPATEKQRPLLKNMGLSDIEALALSKDEASSLISQHLKQRQGLMQVEQIPNWEPATEKQRALLRNEGVSDSEISNLSKQEAINLISELINAKNQAIEQKRMKYFHG